MLTTIYRKYISEKNRNVIYNAFLGDVLYFFRNYKAIFIYLFYSIIPFKTEKQQALRAWGRNPMSPYPYLWKREYEKRNFLVEIDPENGLPFVLHYGKRLYFRRNMKDTAGYYYCGLLIEQDKRCAHRYVDKYEELEGKVLLDIGSAEAIFTLDVINNIKHAYLFECEESWIEALNATFAPWKDKITIVRKYVSDVNDTYNLTLDYFFNDKPKDNLFIKMDIEGCERKALRGCEFLLKSANRISGSVCIYHLKDDKEVIQRILSQNNLLISVVPGYLYFENEFRHAIMRFRR